MGRWSFTQEEPYAEPQQHGASPPGRDPSTEANGGWVSGAPWNADFRGTTFVANDYQGYGELEQFGVWDGKQPTDWNSYAGLIVSQPLIRGYGGTLNDLGMPQDLRAGQDIMFPTHGQVQDTNDAAMLYLTQDPGVDVGWQLQFSLSRRMLFQEPPAYGEQTDPIPAAGWP